MKRTLKGCLLLMWMALIFYFSDQPATDSNVTSGSVVTLIYQLFHMLGMTVHSEAVFAELYTEIIRKLAHFTEFMILGILARSFFDPGKKALICSLLLAGSYGISDEIHQLFVLNRSCEIRDMLIDCAGAFLGVFLCHLIYEWKKK
ncbi:MAG: VanZ family protein [Erysipelotrichaceae bacterium]|nr:VanZ family protein [Erysipelotrichaceae bacterium]